MKSIIRMWPVLLVLLATACSVQQTPLSHTLQRDGNSVVQTLTALYANTSKDCGSDSRPAFLCSGVTLRGTEYNTSFYPWNPSPNSVAKGGVPFSWLRADTNFSSLGGNYVNGFFFYPILSKPSGTEKIEILCYFPVNANTNGRPTLQGCGPHTSYPTTSGPCHELTPKVDTAATWYSHYTSVTANRNSHQCGFDVRDKVNYHAGPNFTAGVDGRKQLGILTNNEMILATWAQNIPEKLPIMAFFYLSTSTAGKTNAKNDQQRFYQQTGTVLPVIQLTLPTSTTGTARFVFNAADQM